MTNLLADSSFENMTTTYYEQFDFFDSRYVLGTPGSLTTRPDQWMSWRSQYGDSPNYLTDGRTGFNNAVFNPTGGEVASDGVNFGAITGEEEGIAIELANDIAAGTTLTFSLDAIGLWDTTSANLRNTPGLDDDGEVVLEIWGNPSDVVAILGGTPNPPPGAQLMASITIPNDLNTNAYTNYSVTFDVPAGLTVSTFAISLAADNNGEDGLLFDSVSLVAGPICFTPDSLIVTSEGLKRISDLKVGDKVQTKDNGYQPLRWIYSKFLPAQSLWEKRSLAPVLVKKDSLGDGYPTQDMYVSPGHLMLTKNREALRSWQLNEALVPANRLAGQLDGLQSAIPEGGVTYIHLLFDQHEIVNVDGVWSESFRPNRSSLQMIGSRGRAEVFEIFPELATRDPISVFPQVRDTFYARNAKRLVRRLGLAGGQLQ